MSPPAFDSGALDTTAQPGPGTIAFGLNVPAGVGHFRVLEIVRASGGACVAVSEAALAAELGREWRRTHGWLSPEGAACLAALNQLLERGLAKRGQRVVAVNAGSAEKYLPALRAILR
jgi:threonine synthase